MDLPELSTRRTLGADLARLGLSPGDDVFVHAGLRRIGRVLGGPDTVIDALCDAVGPEGTILGYCDWQLEDEILEDPRLRPDIPAFDPALSRSIRDNGAFPELLRTRPGARRSGSPGASCAALGARADDYTRDHPLDYGYGPDSPWGRLVAWNGKVLMLGAPLDTMTLLHHAEHLADFPDKRVRRYETPMLVEGQTVWRWFEEFDTSSPPRDALPDDYFATIVEGYLATGNGARGLVGAAPSVLVDARGMVAFAVDWLERELGA